MKDEFLFHGSRGGILGDIKPISRPNCDFGKGFYMGETEGQARTFVCEKNEAYVYALQFRLSEIPEDRILKLDENQWLYAVLAKRGFCKEFNKLKLAEEWSKKLEKYDVIIGKILDDKMLDSVMSFAEGRITDAALKACLLSVDHGLQYVAKTEFACSKIKVLDEKRLYEFALKSARYQAAQRRIDSVKIVKQAIRNIRGRGNFLDEIIKEQCKIEGKASGNDEH